MVYTSACKCTMCTCCVFGNWIGLSKLSILRCPIHIFKILDRAEGALDILIVFIENISEIIYQHWHMFTYWSWFSFNPLQSTSFSSYGNEVSVLDFLVPIKGFQYDNSHASYISNSIKLIDILYI